MAGSVIPLRDEDAEELESLAHVMLRPGEAAMLSGGRLFVDRGEDRMPVRQDRRA